MLRKVTVRENERAFLIRNGRYVRALNPGYHKIFDWYGRSSVEKHNVFNAEVRPETAAIIAKRKPRLASRFFEAVTTSEGEFAIICFDGVPALIQGPWSKRYYWKVVSNVEAIIVKATRNMQVPKKHLDLVSSIQSRYVETALVTEYQAGLLMIDGEFKEVLKPGRYAFWTYGKNVSVRILDLRPIPYDIENEKILTKDRVTLEVNMTTFTKVKNPKKALGSVPDYFSHLHRLMLVGLREALGKRTLDEILQERAAIDNEIAAHVTKQLEAIGIEVTETAIKRITLPNDMRDLLNKVVEAEKDAEANRIRRADGVAATKSLIDNAKLMKDNPYLLRLKQIEVLDKLADRAGVADPTTGRDGVRFDQVLDALMKYDDLSNQAVLQEGDAPTGSNGETTPNGNGRSKSRKSTPKDGQVQHLKTAN